MELPPAPLLCYIKISPVFFSDLKSGRCSSVVEARLLRFWEARNVKRGGEYDFFLSKPSSLQMNCYRLCI
ncbi:hypothetical protein YC2023_029653 [Brassica napus]